MLKFHFVCNDFPFFLKLEALVIVLDTPLISALFYFFLSEFAGDWFLLVAREEATGLLGSSKILEIFDVAEGSPAK